ncbi:MAG: VOC family protein [Hyphomicrobiales bacterium]
MPGITGVAHVELSVRDMDRSAQWYCKLLGAVEVFRGDSRENQLKAIAILEPRSGVVLAFTQHDAEEQSPFNPRRVGLDHVSFAVADPAELVAWSKHAEEMGLTHNGIHTEGPVQALVVEDPDGIPVEFWYMPSPA